MHNVRRVVQKEESRRRRQKIHVRTEEVIGKRYQMSNFRKQRMCTRKEKEIRNVRYAINESRDCFRKLVGAIWPSV